MARRLTTGLIALTDAVLAVGERYRERMALSGMNDRDLKDIGLTHSDIGAVAAQRPGRADTPRPRL